jgi:hypothetical protein
MHANVIIKFPAANFLLLVCICIIVCQPEGLVELAAKQHRKPLVRWSVAEPNG